MWDPVAWLHRLLSPPATRLHWDTGVRPGVARTPHPDGLSIQHQAPREVDTLGRAKATVTSGLMGELDHLSAEPEPEPHANGLLRKLGVPGGCGVGGAGRAGWGTQAQHGDPAAPGCMGTAGIAAARGQLGTARSCGLFTEGSSLSFSAAATRLTDG